MTWDDTDRTELDEYVDEIEENAQQIGIIIGKSQERERIIKLLKLEGSEWLSHDGECDCKIKGEEVFRLIERIEETK